MQRPDPEDVPHRKKLVFVNLSDPSADRKGIRKLVRSSATAHSHRDPTRKQRVRRSETRGGSSNLHETKHRTSVGQRDHANEELRLVETRSSVDTSRQTEAFFGHDTRSALLSIPRNTPCIYLNGGCGDPFRAYPVPPEPWFGWVLDYYQHVQLPPGISVVQHSDLEGKDYIDWHLRESMSEPCLFYMQLLNACTPLVVQGRITQQTVIWLRCALVSALNSAIGDSNIATTIPIFLTVSSIAIHERLYGDKALALNVHGRAFRTMLAMHGGIERIEVPRICRRLLTWTEDILDAKNSDRSTHDLLAAWAPEELRSQHPGYGGTLEAT